MKLTGLSKMVSFLASSQTVLSDLDCIIGSQNVSSHSTGICDEKLLPENVKNFLDDGGKILFVKGLSEYQNQESLSKFFNLIPPKPEKVIFFRIGEARFIALVYYERADDADNIKRLLSHHCS